MNELLPADRRAAALLSSYAAPVTPSEAGFDRILIVDDRPDNILFLTKLLTRLGYHDVVATTDPTSVAAEVARREPDLILLDLFMPQLDGFELLVQLSRSVAADRFLPVLVLTADASRATRRRALAAGATDFLAKPLDATEVAQRVRNLLRTRHLHLQQHGRNRRLASAVQERTEELRVAHAALAAEAFERDLAQRIWRSVVPETITAPVGYRAELVSRPARLVGGDFHLAVGEWVVVGDVSGKGVPAALLTGMFVAALKLALQTPDPATALEQALFDELEKAEMFTTLIAVRLAGDGRAEVLNLGHPPALVVRAADGVIESLPASGPPVGVVRGRTLLPTHIQLQPGDALCLYSDGLLDAESASGGPFGFEGVRALLAQAPAAIVPELLATLDSVDVGDDLTFALLYYLPLDDPAGEHPAAR